MRWLARQKFFIDQGMNITSQFNSVIQNALLMLVVEDKLKRWFHFGNIGVFIFLAGAGYLFILWGIGRLLDGRDFFTHYVAEYNLRNKALLKAGEIVEAASSKEK